MFTDSLIYLSYYVFVDFSPPMIQVDPSYGWEASPSQGIKGSDPTPPFTILQESDPNSFSQLHDINSNYSRSSIAPERSSPRLGEFKNFILRYMVH